LKTDLFVQTMFSIEFLDERKVKKEQHLFEKEIFCKIMNIFTVPFDQFITSLLNKSTDFLLLLFLKPFQAQHFEW